MKFFFRSLLLLMMCNCTSSNDKGTIPVNNMKLEGDVIILSPESPILSNIKTDKVVLTPYREVLTTSGTVKVIPNNYAEIATPFAGRIVKSFVRLGQNVVQGSPIFEIGSAEFFETGKAYYQAKQEMELALKNLRRERDLFQNDVGVAKDLEEAEVNYELKKKDYENTLAALNVFQIDPSEMVLGQPLIVRSPIAGKIVRNDLVIGQYIKGDAPPLALVADLDKVWVVAHVKEKDIWLLEKLEEVEIRLTAKPDISVKGKVYHINELLEEETRSIEVIIECDNREHHMKPFMYATVQLTDTPIEAAIIPSTAILQEENSRYVLVVDGSNRFIKRKITTSTSRNDSTVVLSGIGASDDIIVAGAFYFLDAR